ncbi:MAG: chorismate synthase [Myxococcales bacterium]|nr:chorismate synthase [Myxococcales bacterium]
MSNTFGHVFRVTTFGESHGGGLGVIVDGCPAGHPFPHARIAAQLARRRPGQGRLTSPRQEADAPTLLSGVHSESGLTLGTPIAMIFANKDARSRHYDDLARLYRPSHADYTYEARYGLREAAGGGRASARETVARVAAGALAEDLLAALHGIEIVAWVDEVAGIRAAAVDEEAVSRDMVDETEVRCPDSAAAAAMSAAIDAARQGGDTVGGVVRCVARRVPAGWGAPVFGKLSADLAGALMSLPATRAFEIGEGMAATRLRGSGHNDPCYAEGGRVRTRTNHSGGIQGGISNGETIRLAVAFKPVATIFKPQETVTRDGESVTFQAKGRHDPCVLPRAVPMVEAMVALVLCDHMLRARIARIEGAP